MTRKKIVVSILKFVNRNGFWLGLLAFFILLFVLAPPTDDDFEFIITSRHFGGVGGFLDASANMFATLTGRIVGNSLIYLLADNSSILVVVKAIISVGIIYFATRVANVKSVAGRNILTVALFAVPTVMFRQTFAWSSGFFNYNVPILVALVVVFLLRGMISGREFHDSVWRAVGLYLLGFTLCLFNESVTIGAICVASAVVAFAVRLTIRLRKTQWSLVALAAGIISGAIAMFASPTYRALVVNGSDGYREMASGIGGYLAIAVDNFPYFFEHTLASHTIIIGAIVATLSTILLRNDNHRQTWMQTILLSGLALSAGLMIILYTEQIAYDKIPMLMIGAEVLAEVAFVAIVATIIVYYVRNATTKRWSILWLACAILATLPTIFAKPIAARIFLFSYVFLILFVVSIAKYAAPSLTRMVQNTAIKHASYVVVAVISILYLGVFTLSQIQYRQNVAAIRTIAPNNQIVTIKQYVFGNFIHNSNNAEKLCKVFADSICTYEQAGNQIIVRRINERH